MNDLNDWVYRAHVDIDLPTRSAELIDNIARPSKQGIGTLGIQAIKQFLKYRGCATLRGQMYYRGHEERLSLVRFYEKCGFEISNDNILFKSTSSDANKEPKNILKDEAKRRRVY